MDYGNSFSHERQIYRNLVAVPRDPKMQTSWGTISKNTLLIHSKPQSEWIDKIVNQTVG